MTLVCPSAAGGWWRWNHVCRDLKRTAGNALRQQQARESTAYSWRGMEAPGPFDAARKQQLVAEARRLRIDADASLP